MDDPDFRADCGRCAALCCVFLAFDRSALFAFDKPAGVPCRHLAEDDRCTIHSSLAGRGFGGCIRYDCLGAGQRVVQEVFAGRSWRDDPALMGPMADAFGALREVHELIGLLRTAARLPLPPAQAQVLEGFLAALSPKEGWTLQPLLALRAGPVPAAVRAFLKSLRPVVAGLGGLAPVHQVDEALEEVAAVARAG
jgi:hypothetical protein